MRRGRGVCLHRQGDTMFDWDHVLQAMGGNRDVLREVAVAMQSECPQCMEQIETAVEQDDAESLRRAAHTLKGSLRLFGPNEAMQIAERVEMKAKAGDCSTTLDDVARLRGLIRTVRDEIDAFLADASAAAKSSSPEPSDPPPDVETQPAPKKTSGHADQDANPTDQYSVLVIEDSRVDALVVRRRLASDGRFVVTLRATLAEGLRALQQGSPIDAIILDLNLPDSAGLETFKRLQAESGTVPVIILTGESDESVAVEAMRLGAQDYVYKSSLDAAVLTRSLLYAIERQKRRIVEQRQRIVERELLFAKKVQQHLLPSRPPTVTGFDIAGRCESADSTSGDFFDFISHGDGTWDIVLADVCGHGIGPAMITVGARRLLRSCSELHQDLGRLLTFANRGICEDTVQSLFVTLFFARVDPAMKVLDYVGAGHPAFLISQDGTVTELSGHGIPTGIDPDFQYESDGSIEMPAGSIVLIMTDGMWEAHKNDQIPFGRERAFRLVQENRDKTASEIASVLLSAVADFCRPQKISDDVTAVVIKSL